tara:strand:- start:1737 stop:2573 length:837 start_codon:yes stop_codon:yes gene_type:complete
MKNILIPTDFSENAWNAIEYAVALFEKDSCHFFLIHVDDLREAPVNAQTFFVPSIKPAVSAKNQLYEVVKRVERLHPNSLHHFLPILEYGNMIDALRRTVAEKKIELIVMGTIGAKGLKKLIIGSNTGDVLTKVRCNTLVIPEKASFIPPKVVAFPTDYTIFYSFKILQNLSEMLQMNRADLKVLHVSKNKGRLDHTQEKNKEYLQDYLVEIFPKNHSFHTVLDKKITDAVAQFVTSWEVDLIVMIAKNLNFMQQMLFDSTVEKLSFHTAVPFMVLHD